MSYNKEKEISLGVLTNDYLVRGAASTLLSSYFRSKGLDVISARPDRVRFELGEEARPVIQITAEVLSPGFTPIAGRRWDYIIVDRSAPPSSRVLLEAEGSGAVLLWARLNDERAFFGVLERVEEVPQNFYSFDFFGHRWEVRKDEEGFFLAGEKFTLNQFLSVTGFSRLKEEGEALIRGALESYEGFARSFIVVDELLPDIPLTKKQRLELERLGVALNWLGRVSTEMTTTLRLWWVLKEFYGQEGTYDASYYLCCSQGVLSYKKVVAKEEKVEDGGLSIDPDDTEPVEKKKYTVSEAALAHRQALADKKNWEKFCTDILSILATSEDVISSRELIEVAKNHRAVKKWREKGYLVERVDLREGRRTYWYCPLLEPASADFKNMI